MKVFSKMPVPLLVFTIGFLILASMIQPFPHPGQAAFILAQKLGLDPFPSFASPVYGLIVRLLAAVSGPAMILAIHLFSALCGAGILTLVYSLVYRLTRSFNVNNSFPASKMHRVQMGAGLLSAIYLLATKPFWLAATGANPLAFDLLLLIGSFYLVVSFHEKAPPSRMYLAVLLFGITVVEFDTAILMAPFFGLLVLAVLWNVGMLSARILFRAFACGLLGLSLYLIQAGLYMTTPAYHWREFSDFFQVLWYIWLEQYQGLSRGLPRVGWLTLFLVSIIPWAITSAFRVPGGPGRTRGSIIGAGAVNIILAALAVLLLRDFPLAPATITGTTYLFVTPYIFIALWVGNIMAFWLVVLWRPKRFESPGMLKARRSLGAVVTVAAPLYLVFVAIFQAIPAVRPPADRVIHAFVEAVVDNAADKEWLVTNTVLDDSIALEAHRRNLPIKMIRLAYGRSTAAMRYVASLFSDHPRLESLALVGMEPLMDEWFISIPDADKKIAVVTIPDMWLAAGLEAVPRQVLFVGARPGQELALEKLFKDTRVFWDNLGRRVMEVQAPEDTMSGASIQWIRLHLGKMANNLGVLLDDHGMPEPAYECYKQARVFVPENLSALMNMHVLAHRENKPEAEALEKELIERTENLLGRVQALSLAYVYGYVRIPELFANRGMTFAMSGKAAMAIGEMKRALALREGNPQLQLALAGLYFAQERDVESREYYMHVLEQQPNNAMAILGLMRLSARQRDFDESRRRLQQLRDLGASSPALKMEEAFIESMAGAPVKGLRLLQEVVKEDPENMRAWAALAAIAGELNDNRVREQATKKLLESPDLAPGIRLIMAQSALTQNDRDAARRHLNEILRRQPGNLQALEMMLRIEISEGNRDQVLRSVERILSIDPRNALANYMLGVHHYYKEEYILAESAYRASLASRRTPEGLNDLAYILYLQNRLPEADKLIRESLEMNERNSAAWDTLGVILMKQDQLPEAEEALLKSLALRPDIASVLLSLAMLKEKQKQYDEASRLARDINARLNELSPQSQGQLRDLLRRLDQRQ